MKQFAKHVVVRVLAWQLGRLRQRRSFQVVAVAGSVGKTSTKFAIATMLRQGLRVRFQAGNYNDITTVPLVFFGAKQPSLFNPLAWLKVFLQNERVLRYEYPYDVVVVELGTDGPGQLKQFSHYLHADIGILTALSPEHMEYFGTMEAVAKEELTLAELVDYMIVNSDLCDEEYLKRLDSKVTSYGFNPDADYIAIFEKDCLSLSQSGSKQSIELPRQAITKNQTYSMLAGYAVGAKLGLSLEQIHAGVAAIEPVDGRGRQLAGIKNSVIIDETYNASPDAVKAAIQALYEATGFNQKIALLGNMNELGAQTTALHEEVGNYCDPRQLDVLVTLGPEANKALADAAEAKGCHVVRAQSPQEAASIISDNLKDGALILAKGSQNRVFAEEAVKQLLANPADEQYLVRQNASWEAIKKRQFS